ncbi:MAG: alcohol dehydrogenase catalytic domain-containing protein, partial [Mycolicibacterium sp.]|nr:alcohol dehydrogenase catalytic domain-containing protein [Mycolicibacterium sp.]
MQAAERGDVCVGCALLDHADDPAPRFVYDPDRDTVMGHEFVGEVVGHGPDCTGDFPLGARVTSMPLLIRAGEEPLVIGHHPDARGAYGELMLVSEMLARAIPYGVSDDAVAVVDAFAVGEFYVRSSAITPGDLPLV